MSKSVSATASPVYETITHNVQQAVRESSFYYSLNLLRLLRDMNLLTEDEYRRIVDISANHYGVEIHCV